MNSRIGITAVTTRANPFGYSLEPDACGYIRILLPMLHPAVSEAFDIRVMPPERAVQYETDVLYFNRTALLADELEMLASHCRQVGALLIYDIDDALFALPKTHPEYESYEANIQLVTRCIATSSHVTVSSPVIKEMIGAQNPSVHVLRNAVDERFYFERPNSKPNGAVRIVYMGTPTHEEDLLVLEPVVERLRHKYAGRIAFSMIGGVPKDVPAMGFKRVDVPPTVAISYPGFVTWLSLQNRWDIGLAPLAETPFNRAKSAMKYLDYSVLGLAGVFTDLEPYREDVKDRVNGRLVRNTEHEWFEAISELVENDELRRSLAAAAFQNVRERHTLAAQAEARIAFWRNLVKEPKGIRRIPHVRPLPRSSRWDAANVSFQSREDIAAHFLRGAGIEIGALQNPLRILPGTRVSYVDRMSKAGLYEHYPELRSLPLVEVDIVDDGERLGTLADNSQDFVIANHFIEHCQDPIATLEAFSRVLRPRGVAFLAIPNRHRTFDKDRPATSLEHLISDHEQGPEASRRCHFEEWVKFVEPNFGRSYPDPAQFQRRTDELMSMNYSIHFHVWNPDEFKVFLRYASSRLPFQIELYRPFGEEMVAILRKPE